MQVHLPLYKPAAGLAAWACAEGGLCRIQHLTEIYACTASAGQVANGLHYPLGSFWEADALDAFLNTLRGCLHSGDVFKSCHLEHLTAAQKGARTFHMLAPMAMRVCRTFSGGPMHCWQVPLTAMWGAHCTRPFHIEIERFPCSLMLHVTSAMGQTSSMTACMKLLRR